MKVAIAVAAALVLGMAGCDPAVLPPDDEPVRVRASVQRSDVTPGQPFDLVVEVDKRKDVTFDLPAVGAGIQGLVIMDERHETEDLGSRTLERTVYTLKAPLAGTYLVPGVEAPWKTPADEVGTAGTGPILVEAARAAGQEGSGEETLRDLKPVRRPPPLLWPWALAGIALLVLATAALAAWLVHRRRSQAMVPPAPPWDVALAELATLLSGGLLHSQDQGPFAYSLSAILRRYLEARFAFRAWRMTTPEVLRAMPHALAVRRDLLDAIRDVLEASDRVKFAGQPVEVEELERWVAQARALVEATGPAAAAGEEAPR